MEKLEQGAKFCTESDIIFYHFFIIIAYQIQNAAYNGTIFLRSSNEKFFAESLIA